MKKPDFTAWFVLQGLLATLYSERQAHRCSDSEMQALHALDRAAVSSRLISRLIHFTPYKWRGIIGDFVSSPGRMRHFFLRKAFIKNHAEHYIRTSAISQVVILGAGLDAQSLSLADTFPHVIFFELDMRDTQAFKIDALRQAEVKLPPNLHFIEGDLRDPLTTILSRNRAYQANTPTLWIAEGLLMFIPEPAIRKLLDEIRTLSDDQATIIFTSIPQIKYTNNRNFLLQHFYLKKERCPFQWSMPLDKMAEFLKEQGFELSEQISYKALHEANGSPEYLKYYPVGENIHIANTKKCDM